MMEMLHSIDCLLLFYGASIVELNLPFIICNDGQLMAPNSPTGQFIVLSLFHDIDSRIVGCHTD